MGKDKEKKALNPSVREDSGTSTFDLTRKIMQLEDQLNRTYQLYYDSIAEQRKFYVRFALACLISAFAAGFVVGWVLG